MVYLATCTKMERLSDRLREVVAYKNLTTGGLFRSTLQKIFIACNVTKVFRTFLVHCSIVHTATIEIKKCVKWSPTRG